MTELDERMTMLTGWGVWKKMGVGFLKRVVNENNMEQGVELLCLTKHKMLWYVVPVIEVLSFGTSSFCKASRLLDREGLFVG